MGVTRERELAAKMPRMSGLQFYKFVMFMRWFVVQLQVHGLRCWFAATSVTFALEWRCVHVSVCLCVCVSCVLP
jgi:hypothetical protein